MEPGLADILPPVPREPKLLRTCWRMQGPSRVIVARIERHPVGRELIVAFDGVEDDVIETRFERFEFAKLERRAEELRELLLQKQWVDVHS
jgi:hypothetical protein